MHRNLESTFRRTGLALAVITAFNASNLSAQETEADAEVIVVTGVRSSLTASLANKKDAKSLVDSIAAEELGRFPDDNVADSLSHIAGVTVSRNRNGEAENVNIRGLGPEFSIVTLNNRILATDDGGRNFSFDVIPSEMIGGADVWKTVQARNIEGSIGGAVNLKTARAFDKPGLQGIVSAQGNYNDLSEETGNKITGVFSNTFANDTLGFIIGVSNATEDRRADDLFDNFYSPVTDQREYDVNGDGIITEDETNLLIPGSYATGAYLTDFRRTGVTSSLEWRPNSRLEVVADALITRLDADSTGFSQSFFLVDSSGNGTDGNGRLSNFVLDGNVVTSVQVDNVTTEIVTLDEHRTVDTELFGLAAEYILTDDLTIKGDVYRSTSERFSGGNDTFVVAGAPGSRAHTGTFTLNEGGLPDYVIDFINPDFQTTNDLTNDDFSPHWANRSGSDIEDEVTGFTLDGDWQSNSDYLVNVDFGVAYTSRNKTNTAFDNNANACNYCGYPFTFGEVGVDVIRDFPIDNFFDGEAGNIPRSFPIFDIPSYLEGLAASDGLTITDFLGNTRTFGENESAVNTPVLNPTNSFDIEEDTTAAYFQANLEGDKWFANVGLRWIETDVTAEFADSQILTIDIVNPNSPNPSFDVTETESALRESEGSYNKLLPAVNAGYYFTEELLLRFAAAQTLSRPTLDQLAPLSTNNARSGVFTMNITGNPGIEPVFSDQYDISLEWYFSDSSLLSASVFYKDLEGFIVSNTESVVIAGETFQVTQPINGDTADVLGLEVIYQQFFENGFGVTASYAYTDSDTVVDGEDNGALPGLAEESYSLSLIYEKDKLSAQISLDYTGELVSDPFSPLGVGFETTLKDQSIVTASLQYDITDNAQIFLEGNNLTDESNRTFQGRSDLPGSIQIYGRTIKFGARYSF